MVKRGASRLAEIFLKMQASANDLVLQGKHIWEAHYPRWWTLRRIYRFHSARALSFQKDEGRQDWNWVL